MNTNLRSTFDVFSSKASVGDDVTLPCLAVYDYFDELGRRYPTTAPSEHSVSPLYVRWFFNEYIESNTKPILPLPLRSRINDTDRVIYNHTSAAHMVGGGVDKQDELNTKNNHLISNLGKFGIYVTPKLQNKVNLSKPDIELIRDWSLKSSHNQRRWPEWLRRDNRFLNIFTDLRMKNIRASDRGYYSCKLLVSDEKTTTNFNNNISMSYQVLLDIQGPPFWMVKPNNRLILINGHRMFIECSAKGSPRPTINWYKDGMKLKTHSIEKITNNLFNVKNNLEVSSVKEYQDAGIYRCEISNSFGNISSTSTVFVNDAIILESFLKNQTLTAPNPIRLRCQVKDDAFLSNILIGVDMITKYSIRTEWFKDDKNLFEIDRTNKKSNRVTAYSDGSLIIQQPTMPFDSGWYECRVRKIPKMSDNDNMWKLQNGQYSTESSSCKDKLIYGGNCMMNRYERISKSYIDVQHLPVFSLAERPEGYFFSQNHISDKLDDQFIWKETYPKIIKWKQRPQISIQQIGHGTKYFWEKHKKNYFVRKVPENETNISNIWCVIPCPIKSNPTRLLHQKWWKNDRLIVNQSIDEYQRIYLNDNNPSLYFVDKFGSLYIRGGCLVGRDEGNFQCRPSNKVGFAARRSPPLKIQVKESSKWIISPKPYYQKAADESLFIPCSAWIPDHNERLHQVRIQWMRLSADRKKLIEMNNGAYIEANVTKNGIIWSNLTIKRLLKTDTGTYVCLVYDGYFEIKQITQVFVALTTPQAPHHISIKQKSTSIDISWLPGYDGGTILPQHYIIWHKKAKEFSSSKMSYVTSEKRKLDSILNQQSKDNLNLRNKTNFKNSKILNDQELYRNALGWNEITVDPPRSLNYRLENMEPNTEYEVAIVSRNAFGLGSFSPVYIVRTGNPTTGDRHSLDVNSKNAKEPHERPNIAPHDLEVTFNRTMNTLFITWKAPFQKTVDDIKKNFLKEMLNFYRYTIVHRTTRIKMSIPTNSILYENYHPFSFIDHKLISFNFLQNSNKTSSQNHQLPQQDDASIYQNNLEISRHKFNELMDELTLSDMGKLTNHQNLNYRLENENLLQLQPIRSGHVRNKRSSVTKMPQWKVIADDIPGDETNYSIPNADQLLNNLDIDGENEMDDKKDILVHQFVVYARNNLTGESEASLPSYYTYDRYREQLYSQSPLLATNKLNLTSATLVGIVFGSIVGIFLLILVLISLAQCARRSRTNTISRHHRSNQRRAAKEKQRNLEKKSSCCSTKHIRRSPSSLGSHLIDTLFYYTFIIFTFSYNLGSDEYLSGYVPFPRRLLRPASVIEATSAFPSAQHHYQRQKSSSIKKGERSRSGLKLTDDILSNRRIKDHVIPKREEIDKNKQPFVTTYKIKKRTVESRPFNEAEMCSYKFINKKTDSSLSITNLSEVEDEYPERLRDEMIIDMRPNNEFDYQLQAGPHSLTNTRSEESSNSYRSSFDYNSSRSNHTNHLDDIYDSNMNDEYVALIDHHHPNNDDDLNGNYFVNEYLPSYPHGVALKPHEKDDYYAPPSPSFPLSSNPNDYCLTFNNFTSEKNVQFHASNVYDQNYLVNDSRNSQHLQQQPPPPPPHQHQQHYQQQKGKEKWKNRRLSIRKNHNNNDDDDDDEDVVDFPRNDSKRKKRNESPVNDPVTVQSAEHLRQLFRQGTLSKYGPTSSFRCDESLIKSQKDIVTDTSNIWTIQNDSSSNDSGNVDLSSMKGERIKMNNQLTEINLIKKDLKSAFDNRSINYVDMTSTILSETKPSSNSSGRGTSTDWTREPNRDLYTSPMMSYDKFARLYHRNMKSEEMTIQREPTNNIENKKFHLQNKIYHPTTINLNRSISCVPPTKPFRGRILSRNLNEEKPFSQYFWSTRRNYLKNTANDYDDALTSTEMSDHSTRNSDASVISSALSSAPLISLRNNMRTNVIPQRSITAEEEYKMKNDIQLYSLTETVESRDLAIPIDYNSLEPGNHHIVHHQTFQKEAMYQQNSESINDDQDETFSLTHSSICCKDVESKTTRTSSSSATSSTSSSNECQQTHQDMYVHHNHPMKHIIHNYMKGVPEIDVFQQNTENYSEGVLI
ncbi:hypothetical protein SNEBB_002514 [Seison nebaliae]|nr:hypothetical protein SNEBB_002514 [Seison nebaliae]